MDKFFGFVAILPKKRIGADAVHINHVRDDEIFFGRTNFANGKKHIIHYDANEAKLIFYNKIAANQLEPYTPR